MARLVDKRTEIAHVDRNATKNEERDRGPENYTTHVNGNDNEADHEKGRLPSETGKEIATNRETTATMVEIERPMVPADAIEVGARREHD